MHVDRTAIGVSIGVSAVAQVVADAMVPAGRGGSSTCSLGGLVEGPGISEEGPVT